MSDRRVVVVGAGPAGLATAACLRRRRLGGVILERSDGVGAAWRGRYDRLHLHTPRIQSHLPGYPIPRSFGRWVSRDGVVRYLEDYARHHRLGPRFGVEVQRVDPVDGRWRVTTTDGTYHADAVVLSTGYNNLPFVPDWPGIDRFGGHWIHASDYRTGRVYTGQDVLVVGTGNTGAEIAVDLAEHGASRVRIAVRSTPHIIPRTVAGVPTTLLGILNEFVPAALGDPVNTALQRLTIGDLSPYGIPRPEDGLIERFRSSDVVPIIDVGLVEAVRAGRVEPVAAVSSFDHEAVHLVDGERVEVDAVIVATGYHTGLERIVGHLGVLDEHGRPTVPAGRSHPRAPRLHFVGLRNPLIGLLNAIRRDAKRTARAIDRELGAAAVTVTPEGG